MNEGNQMNDKYYEQAVACVKDHVLPAQMELYRSCNSDLDTEFEVDILETILNGAEHCRFRITKKPDLC